MWFQMHLATAAQRKNMCRDPKVLRLKPAVSIMLGEIPTVCIDLSIFTY